MKKAVKTFFALAAISLALCSCSDSGSSGSDGDSGTENRVLDLRIQNGGVARWIENSASGTYEAHTELVSVTAESDGMHFTIKNPATLAGSDEKYKSGCNWIGVYRLENIGGKEIQTTLARLDKSPFDSAYEDENGQWWPKTPDESISFVYPLCEAGEQYKFKVQIEPLKGAGESLVRENGYFHYLTLTAKGGIGDIDYSNLKNGEWAFASYSDNKATVWTENVIPPQDNVVKNVGTYIDIFYGNKEWKSGETDWYCLYENPSAVEKNVSFELKNDSGLQSIQNYSNTFFAQYTFTFEVPDCPQVSQWRTVTLESDLVSLN